MLYCSQYNHVEVNAQVYMLKNIDTSREYLTMPEAARRSGLTKICLAQLLRKGMLEGFQLSREWFVHSAQTWTKRAT